MELRRKGVADGVAKEALAEVDAESEDRRARELVDRKLRSLAVDTPDQRATAARRLVGMLARKGYGAGTAYRVVREALAEHGAEAGRAGRRRARRIGRRRAHATRAPRSPSGRDGAPVRGTIRRGCEQVTR